MSEQNILNTSATSLFNFDYGYSEGLPDMFTRFQAESGDAFLRRQFCQGRLYDLLWQKRDLATKHALQQWASQYESGYFSIQDFERSRYFTGRFDGPLTFSPQGNNDYSIKARFMELPGTPLFSYPTNWSRDAVFVEERNDFGEDLVKLTGTWTFNAGGSRHGTGAYSSVTTNDIAEWIYYGYGFRVWAIKNNNLGISEVSLDGTVLGTIDQYSSGLTAASAVFTNANTPLGFHRVKLRVTGTKNASSSANTIEADAIEVMQ